MHQRQLIEVDPQRITFNPLNPRKHRGTEYVRLRESIKQISIVQLPTVRSIPGGFYEVIDGEGRVSIAQEEKFEKIWVVSVGFATDEEALVMLQSANTTRSFNFLAECGGLANLHRQGNHAVKLCKQFGISESKAKDMIAVGYFPRQWLAKIEGNIALSEKQAEIWGYKLLQEMLPLREVLPGKKTPTTEWICFEDLYDYSEVSKAIEKVIHGKIACHFKNYMAWNLKN